MLKRLIISFLFWEFVRAVQSIQWRKLFPAQQRTVTIKKPLPVTFETLPNLAGISAGEYFHGLRNRRLNNMKKQCDLGDAAFEAWRAKNNR